MPRPLPGPIAWLTLALLLAVTAPWTTLAAQPRVASLLVAQDADTVVARYDLAGAGPGGAEVRFQVSLDDGETWFVPDGVSGDVGPGVTNGWDKRAVWHLEASHPEGLDAYVRVRVTVAAESAPAARTPRPPVETARVQRLLRGCQAHFRANRLTTGEAGTAFDCYREVLALDRGNADALLGLEAIAQRYIGWAERELGRKRPAKAEVYLGRLPDVSPEHPRLAELREEVAKQVGAAERERRLAEARPGQVWTDPTTGMDFVWVPGGDFEIGCGSWTSDCDDDETPTARVTLDGFWIGQHEVTQAQWRTVMGENPSYFEGDDRPVEKVSWNDAQRFIQRLNARGSHTFALPSEAQWEYACRSGGKREKYSGGSDVDRVAWYGANSGRKTHPVGRKAANGLGIHDMSGNVYEWVQDSFFKDGYSHLDGQRNPIYSQSGAYRVIRGGSWPYDARNVRCANRYDNSPGDRYSDLGLRLLRK